MSQLRAQQLSLQERNILWQKPNWQNQNGNWCIILFLVISSLLFPLKAQKDLEQFQFS